MALPPDLERLATRWRSHPEGIVFAPLAEGLRKRGSLDEALEVARRGTAQSPGYLPGHLVLARICRDRSDLDGAANALRVAMGIDGADPALLDAMAELAEAQRRPSDAKAWRVARDAATGLETPEPLTAAEPEGTPGPESVLAPQEPSPPVLEAGIGVEAEIAPVVQPIEESGGLPDADAEAPTGFPDFEEDDAASGVEVVTESLAELYYRQGHRDRALTVYQALVERSPDDAALRERLVGLEAEVRARRPRPYDARESGGRSVADWLAAIASGGPADRPRPEGLDAFFEPPLASADDPADLDAFQQWLKGLGK